MGIYDSSETRVRPAFKDLCARPDSNWLPQLLAIGSRAEAFDKNRLNSVGALTKDAQFEHPGEAPVEYLQFLIQSRDRLKSAVDANPQILTNRSAGVNAKRQKLLDGDTETINEGLQKLQSGFTASGSGRWWVLEGTTKVDCALFAENATVFIEGKRTERDLTEKVTWDVQRSQVFRNLDVLRIQANNNNTDFFMLLIVDKSMAEKAEKLDVGYEVAVSSWPHLSTREVKQLYEEHYLGYMTWQNISKQFGINFL